MLPTGESPPRPYNYRVNRDAAGGRIVFAWAVASPRVCLQFIVRAPAGDSQSSPYNIAIVRDAPDLRRIIARAILRSSDLTRFNVSQTQKEKPE